MKEKRLLPFSPPLPRAVFILALGGALAGFCNGLLGAGGGIILVLTLSSVMPKDEESRKSVYANALCVMLPLSVLTLSRYGGPMSLSELTLSPAFVLGAAGGGIIGGLALGRLKGRFTDKLFAALTVLSGILMLTR